MKRIIHWYRAYKWLKKMKREKITQDMIDWKLKEEAEKIGYTIIDEQGNFNWNEYQDWSPVTASHINLYQKLLDNISEALINHLQITYPPNVFVMNRARNWNKFGWSYFNPHRGWNWLGGLTKTKR